MAGKSFIRNVTGRLTEILGLQTSAGAGNAGDIPALDSTGRLDLSMMPVGIGPDTATIAASENLASGDFVNLWNSTGIKVRKADTSTSGKEADGFVLSAVTSGNNALVYFSGLNTSVTGLTVGSVYYIDPAVPGAVTTTAPTGTGQVVQRVGKAVSATELEVTIEPQASIILA